MAELQEHGYPDWQRLSQQQTQPLFAATKVEVPKEGLTELGPFYVGNYPAVTVVVRQSGGPANTQVNFAWRQGEALLEPGLFERYMLPENGGILEQQFVCKGPWLRLTLTRWDKNAALNYEVSIQPNALVYAEPRLGSRFMAHEIFALKAGASLLLSPARVMPGSATIRMRLAQEKVALSLLAERLNLATWERFFAWTWQFVAGENATSGIPSLPLNLPNEAVRFKVANESAAEVTGEIYISFP